MEERFPRRFGSFVLLRLIGGGGMGKAYLARHSSWPKLLVVKRMHSDLRSDEGLLKRFVHEAEVATCVKHTNVVPLVAMGTVDAEPFFATEYVLGLSCSEIIERLETGIAPRMPMPVALYLGARMLAGLEAIHEARKLDTGEELNLVHRDMGARNVLVGVDGQPRIIDLGLGKSNLSDWETATNLLAGSPDYMPPEQALGHRVDRRADIYAAAVTIWELIAGRKRIREANVSVRVARAIDARPEPLRAYRDDVSSELDEAIQAAMEPRAEQRTPMARLLRAVLMHELDTLAASFGAADSARWLEAACATSLARERRLLEDAQAAAVGELDEEKKGHTRILVSIFHSSDVSPGVLTPSGPMIEQAPPEDSVSTRTKTVKPLARADGKASDLFRMEVALLIMGASLLVLLAVLIQHRVRVNTPALVEPITDVESSAADPPELALPGPSVGTGPEVFDPINTSTDALPGLTGPVEGVTGVPLPPLSPELIARKRELVARIRLLRRQRFDVSFQRKLTELGSRVSRARSSEALDEATGRLNRLERER